MILFSHGSLMCGVPESLERVAERMRARGDATIVEVGFLNYAEPTFETAFERCIVAGADEIVIVPYFLVAGKFVKVDLLPRISAARRRHPGITVRIAEALRFDLRLAAALVARAEQAVPLALWRRRALVIQAHCRASATCPLYGSKVCRVVEEPIT